MIMSRIPNLFCLHHVTMLCPGYHTCDREDKVEYSDKLGGRGDADGGRGHNTTWDGVSLTMVSGG